MIKYNEDQLKNAHSHCVIHRPEIEASDYCGCFYCLEIFKPNEIDRWLEDTRNEVIGETAICPKCGIDSVIGDRSGYTITNPNFLKQMNDYWF